MKQPHSPFNILHYYSNHSKAPKNDDERFEDFNICHDEEFVIHQLMGNKTI